MLANPLDGDPEVWGNYLEALFWWSIATGLFVRSPRLEPTLRRLSRLAAWILLPFGLSDVVEAQTGAWWQPWWLFVWKALGVLGLAWCGWKVWKTRRPSSDPIEETGA